MIMNDSRGRGGIDYSIIEDYRAMASDAFVDSLIDDFVLESDSTMTAIKAAIEQNSGEALAAVAHRFKGASATIGARMLSALCGEMETLARQGAVETAGQLLGTLASEYRGVRQDLRRLSHERDDALN